MNFVESLEIDKNVFELEADTRLEYLVQFAAPFTGADSIVVAKGTQFAPHGLMRNDTLYMDSVDIDDSLLDAMKAQVKDKYEKLYSRLNGFSFFITEEQLRSLPLKFHSGSRERVLEIMVLLRNPENYK